MSGCAQAGAIKPMLLLWLQRQAMWLSVAAPSHSMPCCKQGCTVEWSPAGVVQARQKSVSGSTCRAQTPGLLGCAGLGKTVTALALFLKTQHTLPRAPPGARLRLQPYVGGTQAAWYWDVPREEPLGSPGRRKSLRRDSAPPASCFCIACIALLAQLGHEAHRTACARSVNQS